MIAKVDDDVSNVLDNNNEALIICLKGDESRHSISVHTKLATNSRLSRALKNILTRILEKQNAKINN